MMITVHKAISDDGGAIGDEINTEIPNALLPKIEKDQLVSGVTVHRKFYFKNTSSSSVTVVLDKDTKVLPVFTTIIFESTGDDQTVADLTGTETDETPITVTIGAGLHTSFWVKVDVPAGSTVTDHYNIVSLLTTY